MAAPLNRHARAVLELGKQAGKPRFETLSPEAARAQYSAGRAVLQPPAPHVAEVREIADGPVPMRLYRPAPGPLPALVFFHGGGWVMGGLDTHDHMARTLALGAGCAVLAVDYRLAPQHRFPAAVEDAAAAFAFAHARAGEFGLDPARLAVGGDSAGGNLAAVLALMGPDGALPAAPRFQLLLYPVTDFAEERASYEGVAPDLALTAPTMRWFRDHYAPDPATWRDWRVSPMRAASLAGLCPAFVLTCAHDPLCDEGRDYAARLEREGVAVTALHLADQMHGFLTMGALVPTAGFALDVAARALREGLS
jgi:acetyl esterase